MVTVELVRILHVEAVVLGVEDLVLVVVRLAAVGDVIAVEVDEPIVRDAVAVVVDAVAVLDGRGRAVAGAPPEPALAHPLAGADAQLVLQRARAGRALRERGAARAGHLGLAHPAAGFAGGPSPLNAVVVRRAVAVLAGAREQAEPSLGGGGRVLGGAVRDAIAVGVLGALLTNDGLLGDADEDHVRARQLHPLARPPG